MIHVIEGIDCTGKTTLVDKIAFENSYLKQHVDGNDPNTYEWYRNGFIGIESWLKGAVCDRGMIGELVYGQARGKCRISADEIISLINEFNIKLTFIYVTDWDKWCEIYKARGEEFTDTTLKKHQLEQSLFANTIMYLFARGINVNVIRPSWEVDCENI